MPRLPGFNGIPNVIHDYYVRMGLPGEVISTKETVGAKDVIYISIRFKDQTFRHKWNDGEVVSSFSKIKADNWTLDVIPL